ncbi:MAG TPA: cache domain-containing protein [Fibrobacteraceae bacterium]|nr:cache domain-containing protein [Fibrobacteraceae bacterium]
MGQDLQSLRNINTKTKLLSLNARIEAAHAGAAGAAFAVVANEVMELSKNMDESFRHLEENTTPLLVELEKIGSVLAKDVRGQRLADLAAANLDVIDRNLYERSCDVRWWATDSGLVSALASQEESILRHASQRMGTILDSYTVYFDLVLCDLQGTVVANGRPALYRSQGMNISHHTWFQQGLATKSGTEFGFEGMHSSSLVNGERVLVYSTAVRENGNETGQPIGVLGVIYRWEDLGQKIVDSVALSDEEMKRTRVLIVERNGRIIASSKGLSDQEEFVPLAEWLSLSPDPRFHTLIQEESLLGLARSQGFETYATGWSSALLQKLEV